MSFVYPGIRTSHDISTQFQRTLITMVNQIRHGYPLSRCYSRIVMGGVRGIPKAIYLEDKWGDVIAGYVIATAITGVFS